MAIGYRDAIRDALVRQGLPSLDPRHVEAWMRVEIPTLDHLTPSQFEMEVALAAAAAIASATVANEALAVSLGLPS